MDISKLSEEEVRKALQSYIDKDKILSQKKKEATKRYYKTDKGKEKLKQSQKKYYKKNREKILARYKEKKDLLKKVNKDGKNILELMKKENTENKNI